MRYTDRKKYMRRIQRAGCTCRSTGTADAVLVKHQKHGLTFDELEAYVYVVRETFYSVTVQSGIWNLSSQTIDQIISQFDFLSSTFFHSSYCTFCCCTISNDSRNILCTCTTFTFLCATMYEGFDLDTFTNIKEADSFRSINLVST